MATEIETTNTQEEQEPTVTVNGVQKLTKDLDENQKYLVAQIQDLEVQEKQLKAKAHQVLVAKEAFVQLLVAEFDPKGEESSDPVNAGEAFAVKSEE